MAIIMKSDKYVVNEILKKTGAQMFKNIEEGDILEFSTEIKYAGISRGRSYAVGIRTRNLTKKESVKKTFNELPKLLENFDLEEYKG